MWHAWKAARVKYLQYNAFTVCSTCNTAVASMKSRTVVIIDIADHGPAQVGVGGGRGCAQDGGRGGAHVAPIQERH